MRSICRDSRLPNTTSHSFYSYKPFQLQHNFKSINAITKFSTDFKSNLKIQRFYAHKAKQADSLSGELIYAASKGDLEKVKTLVQAGATINAGDYDHRTPLHLAASEGHTEVFKYLYEQGANMEALDRWDTTPLVDAINSASYEIIRYLRSKGIIAKKDKFLAKAMCTAAADNKIDNLKKLMEGGVDINCIDADGRTPLHLACSRGSVEAVDFLLNNGAKVTVLDSFGNTPLQNAQRGESKNKRDIVRKLRLAGATGSVDIWNLRNTHEFRQSLSQCLPLLCARGNWIYAEAWIPTDDEKELLPIQDSYSEKDWINQFGSFQQVDTSFKPGEGIIGHCWTARSPVWLSEVPMEELRNYHRFMIEQVGILSGLAVPMVHNDRVLAIILFLSDKEVKLNQHETDAFFRYANGLFASGLFTTEAVFESIAGLSPEKMRQVFNKIVSEGIFNAKHIYQEVDWFFRMGIPHTYFEMFDGNVIAKHIHSLMAAKKLSQAIGKPEDIYVHTEGHRDSLFLCPATYAFSVRVENRIEEYIQNSVTEGHAIGLSYLCSGGTTLPNGKHQLSMYIIDTSPYIEAQVSDDETNIWKIASGNFLKTKSFEIRSRYAELIKEAVRNLNPIFRIHNPAKDGTTPVTLTFRHSQKSSFLLKFTEALKYQNLKCSRKFIETFSNGIVVYSFYLNTSDTNEIQKFLHHTQLLCLIPGSSMRSSFLDGTLSVEQYAYASSLRKCIYYFLNQKSEEFEVLSQALKNDTLNLGRLRHLQTKLRREAVSLPRITETLLENPTIIHKLFADFERCCFEKPEFNSKLADEIKKIARSDIDYQILVSYLIFNAHILKTNFWKNSKAALAFAFDPSFVMGSSLYPENPFRICFLVGQEFQGFHIRFRDIARGGIRVIKSQHRIAFLKNMEGLFGENYDLAHTQNKKNKDIPEFGSKGTILLNRDAQGRANIAFQKYIAAIMDLLIIEEGTVDWIKKEELLFMGPDEYTADMMEWAARYAQTRGYRYWKAFTTGKPPSLGGVPHDTYGMTTRSIHCYVLGCLEKMGLKEEQVSKFQTGGPDGDLGSNEIMISKDKTIGIVDGSGVLYDPLGINREELKRLAKKRRMISEFDPKLLSENGFKVLISDENVKLPSGEIVESGLTFRNQFHLHPLSKADLFVPCGGRPASINLTNVNQFFDTSGKPKYKIIIEGANLFLTQDARLVLENTGVVLYKDASANKGGVTSSSLEVLAAIAMTDKEHQEHMQVVDSNNIPPFYKEYVEQIQQRIEENAKLEFECIWREYERTGIPRCVLTDKISEKINELNDAISGSTLYDNESLRIAIMSRAIPKKLQELISVDEIIRRLPENYAKATFAAYLAAHFIYTYGLNASEFAFFEFVQNEGFSNLLKK